MIENSTHKNLLQFETLNTQESLFTFTTTIENGVSSGNYKSFNLGVFSGDNKDNVVKNRQLLAQEINTSALYFPYQTHQDKIAIIDDLFLDKTDIEQQQSLHGVDAIITNKKNICIGVGTADCVPIIIYDPYNHVLAAIHAGWRGTVERLPEKTIKSMIKNYNSSPQNLLVGIGPSISKKNFEVGDEVVSAFSKANFNINTIGTKNPITQKYHIDLWLANQLAVESQGIIRENIEISGLCTFERSDLFFSARRQTIHSGRMITGGILL